MHALLDRERLSAIVFSSLEFDSTFIILLFDFPNAKTSPIRICACRTELVYFVEKNMKKKRMNFLQKRDDPPPHIAFYVGTRKTNRNTFFPIAKLFPMYFEYNTLFNTTISRK